VLLDEAAAEGRNRLEALPREIDALADVEWYPEIIAAAPPEAIAHVADVRGADEIIVGSRGYGRARALLGSVSHELIHLARCPVTVIPERAVEETPRAAPAEAATT
jgi:nucleotide-binding universal stress UspA family protein